MQCFQISPKREPLQAVFMIFFPYPELALEDQCMKIIKKYSTCCQRTMENCCFEQLKVEIPLSWTAAVSFLS